MRPDTQNGVKSGHFYPRNASAAFSTNVESTFLRPLLGGEPFKEKLSDCFWATSMANCPDPKPASASSDPLVVHERKMQAAVAAVTSALGPQGATDRNHAKAWERGLNRSTTKLGAFQVSLLDASHQLPTSPISLRVARDLFVQAINLLNQIFHVASMTATRFFCRRKPMAMDTMSEKMRLCRLAVVMTQCTPPRLIVTMGWQRHGQRSVPRAPLLSMADPTVACGIEAAVCGGTTPVNSFVLALRGTFAAVARELARMRDAASVDGVLGHGEAYPYALTRGRPTAVAPWPAVSRRRLEAEKSRTRPCHDPGTRLRMLCNLNPRNLSHTLPPPPCTAQPRDLGLELGTGTDDHHLRARQPTCRKRKRRSRGRSRRSSRPRGA